MQKIRTSCVLTCKRQTTSTSSTNPLRTLAGLILFVRPSDHPCRCSNHDNVVMRLEALGAVYGHRRRYMGLEVHVPLPAPCCCCRCSQPRAPPSPAALQMTATACYRPSCGARRAGGIGAPPRWRQPSRAPPLRKASALAAGWSHPRSRSLRR